MKLLFRDYHTYIIIILFILCIIFLGMNIKEHFPVAHYHMEVKKTNTPLANLFNIDNMIEEQPENLGWKKEWRDKYSKGTVELDNSFKDTSYINYSTHNKLLFDGIRDISCRRM